MSTQLPSDSKSLIRSWKASLVVAVFNFFMVLFNVVMFTLNWQTTAEWALVARLLYFLGYLGLIGVQTFLVGMFGYLTCYWKYEYPRVLKDIQKLREKR